MRVARPFAWMIRTLLLVSSGHTWIVALQQYLPTCHRLCCPGKRWHWYGWAPRLVALVCVSVSDLGASVRWSEWRETLHFGVAFLAWEHTAPHQVRQEGHRRQPWLRVLPYGQRVTTTGATAQVKRVHSQTNGRNVTSYQHSKFRDDCSVFYSDNSVVLLREILRFSALSVLGKGVAGVSVSCLSHGSFANNSAATVIAMSQSPRHQPPASCFAAPPSRLRPPPTFEAATFGQPTLRLVQFQPW